MNEAVEVLATLLKVAPNRIKGITAHLYYCKNNMYSIMPRKIAIAHFCGLKQDEVIPMRNGQYVPVQFMYRGEIYSLDDSPFKEFILQGNWVIFKQSDRQKVVLKNLYNTKIKRRNKNGTKSTNTRTTNRQ